MSISDNEDNNNVEPELVGVGAGFDGRVGDGREDGEEKKRRVVGNGDGDGDGDSRAWPAASSEPRRKTIGLTPDAIMEVSRLRVASLLRRSGRASGGAEHARSSKNALCCC